LNACKFAVNVSNSVLLIEGSFSQSLA